MAKDFSFKEIYKQFNSLNNSGYFSNATNKESVDEQYANKQNKNEEPKTKGKIYEKKPEPPLSHNHVLYTDLLKMSYQQLVDYMLLKYGPVPGDYFLTESCKSKNITIPRIKEGLYCHHIDEDKAIMLSNTEFAIKHPFEYQKANRLIYCNIIEHLVIHIKIAEEHKGEITVNNELVGIGGAAQLICRQINDCYSDKVFVQDYMNIIRGQIADHFDEYIAILKYLWDLINNDHLYSLMYKKEDLCMSFDGAIVNRVYQALQ